MNFNPNDFEKLFTYNEVALQLELTKIVDKYVGEGGSLTTNDYDFELLEFAERGGCEIKPVANVMPGITTRWQNQQIDTKPVHGVFEVTWQGVEYWAILITHDGTAYWIVFGPTEVACERLFAAVCQWSDDPRSDVLIFEGGRFKRDTRATELLRQRRLTDLYLDPALEKSLRENLVDFWNHEQMYKQADLLWKRGAILYGPPGNGKTQTLAAIIAETKKPVIYVRSLYSDDHMSGAMNEVSSIYKLFVRANEMAPCYVVWEDIDSIINAENKSYFLNELDGIRPLNGVLNVATTNHLDRLDPAISNRPNRFDAVIEFSNPNAESRRGYFEKFMVDFSTLGDASVSKIVEATEGTSFSHLKEILTMVTILRFKGTPMQEALDQAIERIRCSAPVHKKAKKSCGTKKKKGSVA